MFKAPFSFEGRIRRLEYGLSLILFYVLYFICVLFFGFLEGKGNTDILLLVVMIIFVLIGYWFLLAQGAKRCHDRGNNGFFQIIPFYPLWMLFAPSDYGPNKYGLNPKGEGNETGYEIEDIGNNQQS